MTNRSRSGRIPLLLFLLYGAASLSGVEVAPDLRKIEPLALATGDPAVEAAQAKARGVQGRQPSGLGVFVRLQSGDRSFADRIRGLGGEAFRIDDRLYLGAIPADATRYISRWSGVSYIEAAKMARPMLDLSRPAVLADVVQAGTGLPSAYDGAGTYVGIVDTGIYGPHPDFSGRLESGFSFSPSFDPFEDTDGHGTHVAGIASGDGSSSSGLYTGMAPGSRLLIGKAGTSSASTTDIIKVINDILSFAGTTSVAINLSFGVSIGPHDGTSGFESSIHSFATNGVVPGQKVVITVAAGNERTDQEHFQRTLQPFEAEEIPLSLESGGFPSLVDIWADGTDRYTVRATLGSESAAAASGKFASSSGGNVRIYNQTDTPPNGAAHIEVFFTSSSSSSAAVFLERTRNGGSGKVDAYIDKADGTFSSATEAGTITEPGNAEKVIVVGSFNTKTGGGAGSIGDISTFSSLGPTRDGRIKPDVTAPGSVIYSARSFEATFLPVEIAPNENYVILEGTSMSSPHVAGIAALVWESNPLLTSAQMRERLKRTATPVPPSPNNTWGFGKANALSAVTKTVAGISGPLKGLPRQELTLRADEESSGSFGNTITYTWTAPGSTVNPPTGPTTTFIADTPGVYTVTLTATPGSPPYNRVSATIRVNTPPTASISGPVAIDNVVPAVFTGTGMDADHQSLSFHWILLARPANSSAVLAVSNQDNVTLVPDIAGTYELGLRADDGLDNSALATHTVAFGSVSGSGGGRGSGGCSIGNAAVPVDGPSSLAELFLILLPLFILRRGLSSGAGKLH